MEVCTADDLFGSHTAHIDRFRAVVKPPRRKIGSVVREKPAAKVVHSPELINQVRKARALDYYTWALTELDQWKHRLPAAEWNKLKTHVESLKP